MTKQKKQYITLSMNSIVATSTKIARFKKIVVTIKVQIPYRTVINYIQLYSYN